MIRVVPRPKVAPGMAPVKTPALRDLCFRDRSKPETRCEAFGSCCKYAIITYLVCFFIVAVAFLVIVLFGIEGVIGRAIS